LGPVQIKTYVFSFEPIIIFQGVRV